MRARAALATAFLAIATRVGWAEPPPASLPSQPLPGTAVDPKTVQCADLPKGDDGVWTAKDGRGLFRLNVTLGPESVWVSEKGWLGLYSDDGRRSRTARIDDAEIANLRGLTRDAAASLTESGPKANTRMPGVAGMSIDMTDLGFKNRLQTHGVCLPDSSCQSLVTELRRVIAAHFAPDSASGRFQRMQWTRGGFGGETIKITLCSNRVLLYEVRKARARDVRAAVIPQPTYDQLAGYFASVPFLRRMRSLHCGTVEDAWDEITLNLDDEKVGANLTGCGGADIGEEMQRLTDRLVDEYITGHPPVQEHPSSP
jgi:hypothetical protein